MEAEGRGKQRRNSRFAEEADDAAGEAEDTVPELASGLSVSKGTQNLLERQEGAIGRYVGGSNDFLVSTLHKRTPKKRGDKDKMVRDNRTISLEDGVWVSNAKHWDQFESIDYHWDTGADMDAPLFQRKINTRSSIHGFMNNTLFGNKRRSTSRAPGRGRASSTGTGDSPSMDGSDDLVSRESSFSSQIQLPTVEPDRTSAFSDSGGVQRSGVSIFSFGNGSWSDRSSVMKRGNWDSESGLSIFKDAFEMGATSGPCLTRMRSVIDMWIPIILVGILVGITASLMKMISEGLGSLKYDMVSEHMKEESSSYAPTTAFLIFLVLSLVYFLIAVCMTMFFSPQAAASGIPESKVFLNGSSGKGFFSFRTFVVKVLGNCLAIAAGAPLGREGPMVHIGSMVAIGVALMAPSIPGSYAWRGLSFEHEQRDLVTAGIAAGISAVFNAPIGGVLFAQEDVTSFWNNSITWKAFICSVAAQLTVTSWRMTFLGEEAIVSLMKEKKGEESIWQWPDLPIFIVIGVLSGLLMNLYQWGALFIMDVRKKYFKTVITSTLEAVSYICIVACLYFFVSGTFDCKAKPESIRESHRKWVRYECGKDNYNEFATMSLASGSGLSEGVLEHMLALDTPPDTFSTLSLAVFVVMYFVLSVGVIGINVPYGLFVPHTLIGAFVGRIIGNLARDNIDGTSHPGMYALMGAGACLGGFTRMTVAVSIILLEITGKIELLTPIMMTIIVSKSVAEWGNPHHYFDVIIEKRKMPFLEATVPKELKGKHAGNDMTAALVSLTLNESVENIVQVLLCTTHNGFPIVSLPPNADPKTLTVTKPIFHGLITRSQLYTVLRTVIERDARSTVDEYCDSIYVPAQLLQLSVDLSPACLDPPLIIPASLPSYKVYRMFTELGIRHLTVVSEDGRLLGMITRKDLIHQVEKVREERDEEDKVQGCMCIPSFCYPSSGGPVKGTPPPAAGQAKKSSA